MANIDKKHPRNCVKRKIHKILSTVKTPCFLFTPKKAPRTASDQGKRAMALTLVKNPFLNTKILARPAKTKKNLRKARNNLFLFNYQKVRTIKLGFIFLV